MSIANEQTDTFYFEQFEFKHPVNTAYIIAFWEQWPCMLEGAIKEIWGFLHNFVCQQSLGNVQLQT